MTDNEKKLLQAQHRLDEAKARNRDKERKARNHWLIHLGGDLALYEEHDVGRDTGLSVQAISGACLILRGVLRETGALRAPFFSGRGALTHHRPNGRRWYPSRWSDRALSEGDCAPCEERPPMPSGIDGARGNAAQIASFPLAG